MAAEICVAECPGQGAWLSDGPGPEDRRPLAAGLQLLGQELDYLVYDAHAGFDPDGFGAATGALRGGGLLLLLTPSMTRWPHLPDPQARRITVEPYRSDQLSNRFLTRLTRILATAAELIRVEEGGPIPPPILGPGQPSAPDLARKLAKESDLEVVQAWTQGSLPTSNTRLTNGQLPLGGPELANDSLPNPILKLAQEPATESARKPPPGQDSNPDPDHLCRSEDQRQAVMAILRTARGRARRPLVIVADRGRGKTAALGIAAGELLASGSGQRRILVTGPRLSAVEPLFRHAATRLPGPPSTLPETATHLGREGAELRFLAPDALCQHPEPADLLLVDEAAAIPAPLLETLLLAYPRLVFATTIHGYEGTGRGFEVRFRHALERHTPTYRRIELRTPIRWAPDDPVEALVARALLLDANPAPDARVSAARSEGVAPNLFESVEAALFKGPVLIEGVEAALSKGPVPFYDVEPVLFDRDALAQDEATLGQLFGLLVLAHYQTRPLDLRHLLDGPNLQVLALRRAGHILATALVAVEGGLSAALAAAIYAGQRRPQGHLLPQTLSAHAGLADAPGRHWARIVRLAVHPAVQGQGLGRRLLQEIEAQARAGGLDLLGSSFGATSDLLRFWAACGLHPVHLGTSRNAASGAHAAVVLRPLSPAGAELARRASARFRRRFPLLLAGPFRHLEPGLVADLLRLSCPACDAPSTHAGQASAIAEEDSDPCGGLPGHELPDQPSPVAADNSDPDGRATPVSPVSPMSAEASQPDKRMSTSEDDRDPDWRELAAFAYAQRPFEASLAALQALARDRLGPALRAGHCSRDEAIALIATVLQCRDAAEARRLAGVTGRAQLIVLLRASCTRLLCSIPSSPL